MSKQTAVEWYEIEINLLIEKYEAKEISQTEFLIMKHNLFYPARKMEDQQLIDAHTKGYIIGGGNGDLYDCKTFNK